MKDVADDFVFGSLALVDVELFVSSGAPRSAFAVRPSELGSPPFFDLDLEVLQRHGWTTGGPGLQAPEDSRGNFSALPHPYALGPKWTGGPCWRADFGDEVTGIVDHDWCEQEHERINGGPPPTSGSPWRWAFITNTRSASGRAESPLHAAATVEALAREHGSIPFECSPNANGTREAGT